MDNSLFSKYARQIKESGDKKDAIIDAIRARAGITLSHEDISLTKKEVTLFVTSAQHARLTQANIKGVLEEMGYSLAY